MSLFRRLRMIYLDLSGNTMPVALEAHVAMPLADYSEKLAAAIALLGPNYVMHPSRQVQKGNYEQKVLRCDVAATFKRIQKQLEKEKQEKEAGETAERTTQ